MRTCGECKWWKSIKVKGAEAYGICGAPLPNCLYDADTYPVLANGNEASVCECFAPREDDPNE